MGAAAVPPQAAPQAASGGSGHFNPDRLAKYGYGVPRLLLLTLFAFALEPHQGGVQPALHPSFTAAPATPALRAAFGALSSPRWLVPAALGALGAGVNVNALHPSVTASLLLLAAAGAVGHTLRYGPALAVYLAKTFAGDFIAGKLDTAEWLAVLGFTAALSAFVFASSYAPVEPYGRIFALLFVVQTICELGDNYAENWKAFRHRYVFEVLTALLLVATPGGHLEPHELAVIRTDLVACLFYRLANFGLCVVHSPYAWVAARKAAFTAFGVLRGTPMQNVTDPGLAMQVLKASDEKGAALERYVASPAWLPLVSLESIDGPLYTSMLADLHALVATLQPPSALQAVSQRRAEAVVAAGGVIDADAVASHACACLLEYLFGESAVTPADVALLVHASWEWRKEIAVRGKGDAGVKAEAVATVLRLLRAHPKLWALHGEKWVLPRYHSLIMQPLLISPIINVGDIFVTVGQHPHLSLDDAIRTAHPFPIFERVVRTDVLDAASGRVTIRAGTHVIIFSSDLSSTDASWPVFGAGPRACAGTAHALALMKPMHVAWRSLGPAVLQPHRGHRFSGRNNDSNLSLRETLYFVRVIGWVVLFAKGPGVGEAQAMKGLET
jgi:hypothetical protein